MLMGFDWRMSTPARSPLLPFDTAPPPSSAPGGDFMPVSSKQPSKQCEMRMRVREGARLWGYSVPVGDEA